jgi:hypothetical protein
MEYYTKEVKIPSYGWTIKVFEPTIGELTSLIEAGKASPVDWDKICDVLPGLVREWDATDRKGVKLEINKEAMVNLPISAKQIILTAVFKFNADDEPKNASVSTPTSPPAPGEKPPEIRP